jgi:hypothetical protein
MTGYPTIDIEVRNEGSLFVFWPRSNRGEAWLDENLDPDVVRYADGYVVEHWFALDIARGAQADGLVLR